jgi:hypothetical protein
MTKSITYITAPHLPASDEDKLKQVKVTIDKKVASAFKKACHNANVSMASKLTQLMAEYSNTKISKAIYQPDYSTKRRRRASIHKILHQLEQIRDGEMRYQDAIPENLRGALYYNNSEEFISYLDSAIENLDSIDSI